MCILILQCLKIKNTIIKNPVAKLQIIDGETIPLLYDIQKEGIILKAGWVGFLQKHDDVATDLVQNAFMDYILSLKVNKQAIDDRQALKDFLFSHYLF